MEGKERDLLPFIYLSAMKKSFCKSGFKVYYDRRKKGIFDELD